MRAALFWDLTDLNDDSSYCGIALLQKTKLLGETYEGISRSSWTELMMKYKLASVTGFCITETAFLWKGM